MKEHLIHYFPFLNKEFRKLSEDELHSEETFKELFPNEPIELHKLRAIYTYQNNDEFALLSDIVVDFRKKPKTTPLKGKLSKEVINYLTDNDAKV